MYEKLVAVIQQGDFAATKKIINELLDVGKSPNEIIDAGINRALSIVGTKFSAGECYIPEMMVAAKASQVGLEILKPILVKKKIKPKEKIVIGTIEGDLHDIGKNIVAMTLEAAGFIVFDLGVNVPSEQFVNVIKGEDVQIVALSCLLTTTLSAIEDTTKVILNSISNGKVKIMIGGPPTTDAFASAIGADFRGELAYDAVLQAQAWSDNS
jgi:5-methyltetrahydrofolate--homocysteine methyltransferase